MQSLDQARTELHDLLTKPALDGIPLLVLGNKNDVPSALSTTELIDCLELKVRRSRAFLYRPETEERVCASPYLAVAGRVLLPIWYTAVQLRNRR